MFHERPQAYKQTREHGHNGYLLTAAPVVRFTVGLRQDLHRAGLEHGDGACGVVGKLRMVECSEYVLARRHAGGRGKVLSLRAVRLALSCHIEKVKGQK